MVWFQAGDSLKFIDKSVVEQIHCNRLDGSQDVVSMDINYYRLAPDLSWKIKTIDKDSIVLCDILNDDRITVQNQKYVVDFFDKNKFEIQIGKPL